MNNKKIIGIVLIIVAVFGIISGLNMYFFSDIFLANADLSEQALITTKMFINQMAIISGIVGVVCLIAGIIFYKKGAE